MLLERIVKTVYFVYNSNRVLYTPKESGGYGYGTWNDRSGQNGIQYGFTVTEGETPGDRI